MRFYTEEATRKFGSFPFTYILTSLDGHIFSITLNRPERRNAFTPSMAAEIAFALAYAHYHSQIRCVILQANGTVFCAGADLNAFHNPDSEIKNPELPEPEEEILLGDVFSELEKPCIAQVEGAVLAGGFLLICGATFVISVPGASFSLPEVTRGIWPMQVMASLLRIISPRKVLEMSVTGQIYSAEYALSIGLITKLAQPEEIGNAVRELAVQICQNAPLAIRMGMEAFQKLSDLPEKEQHIYLKSRLDKLLLSEDAKEGAAAFKEKRKPIWKGK